MNGSSLFSNKLTNVAMPCFSENGESSNLNDGKNSKVDCSLINTCSSEEEVSSNDLIFESKTEEIGDLNEKKNVNFVDDIECQPSPNLNEIDSSSSVIQRHDEQKSSPVSSDITDHEIDSSSSVIQCHDEQKSSPVSSDTTDHEIDSSSSVIQCHDEQKSSPVSSDITDHEIDSSSSVIQRHDEQKSSPVSSDTTDHEIDSSSSVIQSHDEQKSSPVSSDITDQTEPANPQTLLTEELNSTDSSFNFKDRPKNCTGSATFSDHMSNIDLRSQSHFQNEQGSSESIDSLLSFDDKLEEICSTDLEKSQNMKVTTESNLLIAENKKLFKDPKNERMVDECEDTEMGQYNEVFSKDMKQENEAKSTNKDLFTEVDTIDSNSNGNSNNKVFHETLSCLNSCKEDVPELINSSVNSCTNQIVVLESVSLSNPENISSDISESISLFEVHGLENSEDSSHSISEENTNLAKDGRPNSDSGEDCMMPDDHTEVHRLQNSEDSSHSKLEENTYLANDERPNSVSGGDCMKPIDLTEVHELQNSEDSDERPNSDTREGYLKPNDPTSPPDLGSSTTEVLNNETENEMAWLTIEESKDGLIETISTSTCETMFEASLIDTKEGIQCKEIYPMSCKDEKIISPYTKFGLKSCRVDLGDSRISRKLLKSMEDPFSNKPNFNRLKRKLEIMLISAQKEEDIAMRQLKKMKNDKSIALQDILKEIQKIKKKFKV